VCGVSGTNRLFVFRLDRIGKLLNLTGQHSAECRANLPGILIPSLRVFTDALRRALRRSDKYVPNSVNPTPSRAKANVYTYLNTRPGSDAGLAMARSMIRRTGSLRMT
jgi:hypothetical protein